MPSSAEEVIEEDPGGGLAGVWEGGVEIGTRVASEKVLFILRRD